MERKTTLPNGGLVAAMSTDRVKLAAYLLGRMKRAQHERLSFK